MSRLAYLDYNAGAPARPEVVAAMTEALAEPGNPSSVHACGRAARALMKAYEGDTVQLRVPGGVETLEVIEIRYPDMG